MRKPGTSANYLREDFVFSYVGVVPIQLAGERQPFVSAEHVSGSRATRTGRAPLALTARELKATQVYTSICPSQQSGQGGGNFLSAAAELKSHGRCGRIAMSHSSPSARRAVGRVLGQLK